MSGDGEFDNEARSVVFEESDITNKRRVSGSERSVLLSINPQRERRSPEVTRERSHDARGHVSQDATRVVG